MFSAETRWVYFSRSREGPVEYFFHFIISLRSMRSSVNWDICIISSMNESLRIVDY
jgi:hypothetical protein